MSSSHAPGAIASGLLLQLLAGTAAVALTAGAAQAQTPAPAAAAAVGAYGDEETEVEELVVVAGVRTLRGSVAGDIAPEVTLSAREIRAYGAASVSELLEALAPQTGSGQGNGGRPVVLINGARASGFSEIRDLPTEAIARVEILPEEVSLKYGYPAEQKVVNMVLRQRFRATLAEGSVQVPTQGAAGSTVAGHAAVLRIQRGQRLTLDAKATQSDAILEADREVIGASPFRTLQPDTTNVVFNAVYARPLGNGVSGTLNGTYESTDTDSKLGLSPFSTEALTRRSTSDNASLAGAMSGAYAGWQWSYTGALSRNVAKSFNDRALGAIAYTDRTRSVTTSAQSDIVLNRAFFELPAGQIGATLTGRVSTTNLESEALRAGGATATDLTRNIGQLQASFDVPLLRDGEGLGETFGKLSGNVNLGYQHLSDYGDLETVGAGLNWTPVKPLRLLASVNRTDQAPSINQLGDPVVTTPGVRVFDLSRGETVDVTRVSGGSPNLTGGQREVLKLGVTYKPFDETNLTFQANYVSSRTEDVVASFPSASTQVEAAFPNRFVRDASGALVQIDARPVNFARQARDELRYGFTYSRNVGPQPTPEQIAAMRQRRAEGRPRGPEGAAGPGAPATRPERAEGGGYGGGGGGGGYRGGGGRGGGGGGFGGFGGGGPRGGVFQFGVYHTVAFRDDILIRPGVPELDLLDGAAIGAGGGSPRHEVDVQANYTKGGLGASLNANWQAATRVEGGPTADDLEFSDQTTVNLRLFADLGAQPIARDYRWLRGARATLSVDNLFDSRQEVRDGTGVTPISYQPDLLDPVGRSVKLTLRKLFF
ncbi:MAG: TonB-dependent receptor [Pseudomonadota bacterium]